MAKLSQRRADVNATTLLNPIMASFARHYWFIAAMLRGIAAI
jgi:hypothetical protein